MRSSLHPNRLLFMVALLVTLACNLSRSTSTPGSSATATPAAERDIPISATPIQLVIPSGLATGATATTVDVVTDQTGASWDVAPAHLQLTLQGYSLEISSQVPQVFVYPAGQYSALNPTAAESLKRLQSFLAAPSSPQTNDTLPHVPFFNAGQVFAAQVMPIHFNGGSGVRFITQYAQDISPINNGGLIYHFQGLSQDGRYYMIAILPVNLPFLAADNNPSSPLASNGVPFPPSSAGGPAFEEYFKQVTQRIDAATSDAFSPSLSQLDKLIESISVN